MYINLLVCIFFLVMGYLIRFKKKFNLIAGYQKGKVKNEEKYASFIGNYMFILSGISFIFALSIEKYEKIQIIILIIYVAIIILSAIYVTYRSWRM